MFRKTFFHFLKNFQFNFNVTFKPCHVFKVHLICAGIFSVDVNQIFVVIMYGAFSRKLSALFVTERKFYHWSQTTWYITVCFRPFKSYQKKKELLSIVGVKDVSGFDLHLISIINALWSLIHLTQIFVISKFCFTALFTM